jgi:ribosomal protein L11 methyltransferase
MRSISIKEDSNKFPPNLVAMRDYALRNVVDSPVRITPSALAKQLFEKYGINKKQIKSVIRNLVAAGELAYTYEYGATYLERSYNRPVRVSQYVVLQPPGYHCFVMPDRVAVRIQAGASFGDGRHPTTRLAIRGIEMVLRHHCAGSHFSGAEVLDVGCGSGVLVITAVRLTAAAGLGIDIDACARAEARHNVQLNALENRIEISAQPLKAIRRRFRLVTANLRYPSLKQLRSQLSLVTACSGAMVISGIRDTELNDLLGFYADEQWICRWMQTEAGWAGAVLQRIKGRTGKLN